MIIEVMPTWTLVKALELIRELNLLANEYGYHLGLMGSVLIKNSSYNDVDVCCFPLHTGIEIKELEFIEKLKEKYTVTFLSDNKDYQVGYADIWRGLDSQNRLIDFFFIKEE